MYKKVVVLSLLIAFGLFYLDKIFFSSTEKSIPDPEQHIREVVGLLKENDLKGFLNLVMPMEVLLKMEDSEAVEYFSGFPGMNESMGKMAWDMIKEKEVGFSEQYENMIESDFKDTRRKMNKPKRIEIEYVQWKLVGNSQNANQFRCNAKIFVNVNSKHYCIKYKYFLFYGGRWYAGNLTDVDELTETEFEYMPDMYQEPAVEEYIDREQPIEVEESGKGLENPTEGLPESEED